jgi:hypothetical protein
MDKNLRKMRSNGTFSALYESQFVDGETESMSDPRGVGCFALSDLENVTAAEIVELISILRARGITRDFSIAELLRADGLVVYDKRGRECRVHKRLTLIRYLRTFGCRFARVQDGFPSLKVSDENGGAGATDVAYIIG